MSTGSEPIIQDEIVAIARLLHRPAGEDPRFATLEGIRSHRVDFLPLVHGTWKRLHNRALDELLKIEQILRSPDAKNFPKEFTWYLRRSEAIWRRVNDALVWAVLGLHNGHFIRRLSHGKRRPVLAEANPEPMRRLLDNLNSDPLSIALWSDATSSVDVGDLVCNSLSKGLTGILEVKEGKVNDAIAETLSSRPRDVDEAFAHLDALAEKYGRKAIKQLERVLRQMERLDQTLTILEKDEGFDPQFETRVVVREAQTQDRSYDELLISLFERAADEPVVELIDRCLWVYVDLGPAASEAELIERFSSEVFQKAPHVRAWIAEQYQSDVLQPVFSLDENLYVPEAIPIFFRAFDPETVGDILMGRLMNRVLLYFDWVEYARVVEEHGAELRWSSEKAARAQQSLPHHKRTTIVGGHIPIICLPDGRSITGHSKIYRVYFDGILPSVVAAQYIEVLQAQ